MTPLTLPTIAAGARARKSIATCARLLALAGLEEMLRGEGRFTLFAPTNLAFEELAPGVLSSLENDPARLRATLEYHILCVDRELSQIRNGRLATLEGTLMTSIVTDDGLRLDHATVSVHPLRCANGFVYEIGAVLFPGFTPQPSAAAQKDSRESPWSGRRRVSRAIPPPAATAQPEDLFQSLTLGPRSSSTS